MYRYYFQCIMKRTKKHLRLIVDAAAEDSNNIRLIFRNSRVLFEYTF